MTNTTFVHDGSGTPIGSYTEMETPTGKKIVIVCYRHHCRRIIDANLISDMDVISRWLREGAGVDGKAHMDSIMAVLTGKAPAKAEAEPPLPPPPDAPPDDARRVKRGDRVYCKFGPFLINELARRDPASGDVVRSGFSLICGRHTDIVGDKNLCSSDFNFGASMLEEQEVLRRLKRWALKGFGVDSEACPRASHMKRLGPARKQATMLTAADWDSVPRGLGFTEEDLDGL